MILVRHASAGDREEWEGLDRERPLDKRGRKQAKKLVERLASFRIDAVLSSPAVRCIQTVEPLARARGVELEVRRELAEEQQGTDGAELLRALAGGHVVVCGHGGLENAIPDAPRWRKGDALLVDEHLAVRGSA